MLGHDHARVGTGWVRVPGVMGGGGGSGVMGTGTGVQGRVMALGLQCYS